MDIRESDILGADIGHHWYYRAKAEAVRALLGNGFRRVVDVGAGSGFFSRNLLINSSVDEVWCIDVAYDVETDGLEAGKPIHFRRTAQDVDADLVLMMDVLEHVDDDAGLMREYAGRVPPGATFLVSVPAFQFLWSGHDRFLGHKRRYRLAQLENCVLRAGLSVRRSAYYFAAVFPLAVATRLSERFMPDRASEPKSQLRVHDRWVNGVLYGLSHAELPLMRFNRLFGLSAFCVAES